METTTMTADKALISGVIPVLIIENTLSGNVVEPGPDVRRGFDLMQGYFEG